MAKQIADNSSNKFGANRENNPKEECKAVVTRGRMATIKENEKRVGEEKQLLVIEPAIKPVVESLCKCEEEEEVEDGQLRETPIIASKKEINEEENKEKQKQYGKTEKDEQREEKKNSKSEHAREKKKEAAPVEEREVPYPLVPSKKDTEQHLAWFHDLFRKLDITMPFEEALQQMSLYSKFLKDLQTKKSKYIHSDTIVVEGNYSVVIQQILPPKHKDPGSVTIPCSIGVVSVGKDLIDLGANINLMSLSMCQRIGDLEIMPT